MTGLVANVRGMVLSASRLLGMGSRSLISSSSSSRVRSASSKGALEENRRARVELAAAYRIMERLDLHEGICNHLSLMTKARDGSGDDVMLLIPYGLHWREVTASSLLGIGPSGNVEEGDGDAETSAYCIHLGVRHQRTHTAVFHAHPPYVTALGCLKDPTLLPCHQTAIRFQGQVAYDTEFGGFGDSLTEGRRLGSVLGPEKQVLMMGNHGVLAVGHSAAYVFDQIYYLERVAMMQVLAMSTGRELSLIGEDIIARGEKYVSDFPKLAQAHFDAQLRLLHRECPEFAT